LPRFDAGEKDEARMTKILLVGDSKFLRLATERAPARAGYHVSAATEGGACAGVGKGKEARRDPAGYAAAEADWAGRVEGVEEGSGDSGDRGGGVHGVSQKNPVRLQQDGACAFLEKSELGLDQGCDSFLAALAGIVKKLNLQVPGFAK
jgi:hypothetical protein